MGSVHVLEAVRHCDSVRSLVYITSDKCYENVEWVWGYRENDRLGGHDPYSASKAAAEIVFSAYARSYFSSRPGLGAATARAGNVIGGGDWAADRIVPDCVRAAEQHRRVQLRNPHSTRPWQHVLEPISGYLLLAAQLRSEPAEYGGSWNFGPSSADVRTVEDVANTIARALGRDPAEADSPAHRHHEARLLQLNCDKAHQLLGWQPRWGADKALSATAEWYQAIRDGADAGAVTRAQMSRLLSGAAIMIEGVTVTPLRQIFDERGRVMHMLREDSPVFERFGEIYFSCVHPGAIKAWHLHKRMTLNYAVIFGEIKFVLYDDRPGSSPRGQIQEFFLSPENYQSGHGAAAHLERIQGNRR